MRIVERNVYVDPSHHAHFGGASADRRRKAPSDDAALLAGGFVRDERDLRLVGEAAD